MRGARDRARLRVRLAEDGVGDARCRGERQGERRQEADGTVHVWAPGLGIQRKDLLFRSRIGWGGGRRKDNRGRAEPDPEAERAVSTRTCNSRATAALPARGGVPRRVVPGIGRERSPASLETALPSPGRARGARRGGPCPNRALALVRAGVGRVDDNRAPRMSTVVHRHPRTAALLGYIALAGAATWPLLPRFTSEIGGDHGDAWQTLWGFWWWRDAVARGASPFHCDVLRWPWGTPTWFQTWNLPATLAVLPLWPLTPGVPEVALYNLVLFASYVLSGYTAYLLCRELWVTELADFLAGALYTVNAYHFGHALGHLHVVSMEWSPLYFLGLVRTVRRRGLGGPALAGGALALAACGAPRGGVPRARGSASGRDAARGARRAVCGCARRGVVLGRSALLLHAQRRQRVARPLRRLEAMDRERRRVSGLRGIRRARAGGVGGAARPRGAAVARRRARRLRARARPAAP